MPIANAMHKPHPSSTLDVLYELGLGEISKPLGLVHAFDEPFAIRMDHLDATPISSLCLCEDLNQFPLCVVVSTPTSFLFCLCENTNQFPLCIFLSTATDFLFMPL
jgi:hypothetical protein